MFSFKDFYNKCKQILRYLLDDINSDIILCSDTSQITPFSRECFLRHYGGQLKTSVEQEAAEKIDCKR